MFLIFFTKVSATALLDVLIERAFVSIVMLLSISFALMSRSICCWSLAVAGRVVALSRVAAVFRCCV
jgi:hypothetical protein